MLSSQFSFGRLVSPKRAWFFTHKE